MPVYCTDACVAGLFSHHSRRATREQLKSDWLEKNSSEVKPRVAAIEELEKRILQARNDKAALLQQISRIDVRSYCLLMLRFFGPLR